MKIAIAPVACLLLGACSAWPAGSYVGGITPQDAAVIAPSITTYLASAVSSSVPVHIVGSANDPILLPLNIDLDRRGIRQDAAGEPVRYVVDPLGTGLMLWVSLADREGAAQYFVHTPQGLALGGPMTVMVP